MPERTTCPDCGAALPAGSTRGLCPRCLLRAGLADPSDSGRNGGPAASVTSLSVLNSIAATLNDPTEAAIDAEVRDLFSALGD